MPGELGGLITDSIQVATEAGRKPVVINTWFGDTSEEETDSDFNDGWSEVDRRKRNVEKQRRMKRMRKEKVVRCVTKAAGMAGVGPVRMSDVMELVSRGMNFEKAKLVVLKDFLRLNLGYNETELEELSVIETKFATKGDDVLNVAMEVQDHIRELHVRRAECQNDRLIVRNFIPPNFYGRYMALSKICAERRAQEPDLKTQLRFGRADIEVYTKYRGEAAGYRVTKLEDFTDPKLLPAFDHSIRWRKVTE